MTDSTSKTIAVDGRPYSDNKPYFGIVLYTNSILQELLKAGYKVTLLSNRPLNNIHSVIKQCTVEVFGSENNFNWELRDLPKHLRLNSYDIYFAGTNRGIPWGKIRGTKKVLGFLDAIPYKLPGLYIPRYKFHFVRHELLPQLISLFHADQIITISQSSVDDIKRLFKRRNVIHLPLIVSHTQLKEKPKVKDQFVYIGGENPRKRVDNLLKAFAEFVKDHPEYHLVLIGKGYEVYDELISSLNLQGNIYMPGYVSEEDKYRTIASSKALVYPSMYEGYGLEIAEGILADTAVVADPSGASREVGGQAVIYIDATDSASIQKGMEQSLDSKVQTELRKQRAIQLKIIHDDSMKNVITSFFDKQVKIARSEREK